MIRSWKHKGLQRFFETGVLSGIRPEHAKRLSRQLFLLDQAAAAEEMNLPGYRLHQLTGDRKGIWSVTVSGNWRLTFFFEAGDAYVVNYEDYH